MNLADVVRIAWNDIEPDAGFITELLLQLGAQGAETGGLDDLDRQRHPWIVAGAIAGVVGVGIAAYEVHRIRRRRTAA